MSCVLCPLYHLLTDIYFLTESGMDYDGINVILLFAACQRRSCVNVTIIDDEMLENTESFNFTLERTTGLSDRITLDPVDGVVEIIDDDGMFVSSITFFH